MFEVPDQISICVTLNARDVRWATSRHLANPRFLLFIALIVLVEILNTAMNSVGFVPLYFLGFAFAFVFVLLPWIQAAISMRNPVMRHPFCHTFSRLGISTNFHGGSLSLDWSNIKKASETKRYLSIYGKRGAPMLLPKHQVNEGELASIRAILKINLHDEAKLQLSK